MNSIATALLCAGILGIGAIPSIAGTGVGVGDAAPAFTLTDSAGQEVSLADFKGKVVVLEWVNPDCPFVQRHYKAGTMKDLAAEYAPKGVVWLAINSTNYMDAQANAKFKAANDLAYPILVDQSGEVGHLYGAMTTPHLFIIDSEGMVVYMGAIDDDPRGSKSGSTVNYVSAALDQVLAGEAVTVSETKPYGCSVKYKK
jgi:peroxiredoxin